MVWHGSSHFLWRTGTVWLCKIIFMWSSAQVVIAALLSLFSGFFSLKCLFTAREGGEEKKVRKKKAKPLSSWTTIKLLEGNFTEGGEGVQSLSWTIWRAVISSLCFHRWVTRLKWVLLASNCSLKGVSLFKLNSCISDLLFACLCWITDSSSWFLKWIYFILLFLAHRSDKAAEVLSRVFWLLEPDCSSWAAVQKGELVFYCTSELHGKH